MGKSNSVFTDSRLFGNIDARIECSNIHTFNDDKGREGHSSNCTECSGELTKDTPFINLKGSCQPYVLGKHFIESNNYVYNNTPRGSYANAGDYEVGTYGYHNDDNNGKERLKCCVGILTDNTSCAPCWCPKSTDGKNACVDALNRYCSEKNESGKYRIFDESDDICKRYSHQREKHVVDLKKRLCNSEKMDLLALGKVYSNESKSGCIKYCTDGSVNKSSELYCDENIKRYCNGISVDKAINEDICACFMPTSFYDKIVLDMRNYLGLAVKSVVSNPVCIYPKCTHSTLKPVQPLPCQSVISCTNTINLNNDGSISADSIGINATNNCVEHPLLSDGTVDTSKTIPKTNEINTNGVKTHESETEDGTVEKVVENTSLSYKYGKLSGGDKAIIISVFSFFILMFLLILRLLFKKNK
jgi:hypothetical protein